MVHQSVAICLILSAVGGAIEVFATAILARKDAQEKQTGKKWSSLVSYLALAANVTLQVLSSVIGNLFAPWFGPVSLVGPVFLSAQLLANMIIFGAVLGLESFNKDMRVGTYIVVTAVVMLPIVGPTTQEVQDIIELLSPLLSLLWGTFLVAAMMISCAAIILLNINKMKEWKRMGLLLVARATAFTINLTVSKIFMLNPPKNLMIISLVLKVTSGMVMTYALVVQSTAVVQAKFVPLNASVLIIVNALTGMIIWDDWRVVGSWTGYATIFLQLILGNYLLLGDIDIISPENTKYGRARVIEAVKEDHLCHCSDSFNEESGHENQETNNDSDHYTTFENDKKGPSSPDLGQRAMLTRQITMSHRESWSSVYGLDGMCRPSRWRTIFEVDVDEPLVNNGGEIC